MNRLTFYMVICVTVIFVVAETLTVFVSPFLGLGCYIVSIPIIFWATFFLSTQPFHVLLLYCGIRISVYSIPLQDVNPFLWPIVLGFLTLSAIIALSIAGSTLNLLPPIKQVRPGQLVYSLLIGTVVSIIWYLIESPSAVTQWPLGEQLLYALGVFVFVGLLDAYLFWGIFQHELELHMGTVPSYGVVTTLIVSLQLGEQSLAILVWSVLLNIGYCVFHFRVNYLSVIISYSVSVTLVYWGLPVLLGITL